MTAPARFDCAPYSFAEARALARDLGVSPVTAAVLARRGHRSPAAAREFLAARDSHDPFAFDGMGDAVALVRAHVERRSKIVVHGDYDVDGVCSTAVLVRALRRLGGDPGWHVPAREDGYGLSLATVERLAAAGTKLLVTVDCGIGSLDEVRLARQLGVDVLVTDHHRPGAALPECPLLHPLVCGYPFGELCATAVAHKLAQALLTRCDRDPRELDEDLDLVALATVCDVVPLLGENRRLVRDGLREMRRTRKVGLRALMRVAALDPGGADAHALGFRLGPRLNAAGRLERADAALELLLTEDDARAAQVADELDLMNRERREVENRILFEAEALRPEQDAQAAFVLAAEGWHPGVIGIVASRLVERHNRPCVLIALGPDGGRGSGRSIAAYDLHAGLAACSQHLRRFGGHRMAAGLDIAPEGVPRLREALAAHAAAALTPHDLARVQRVDAVAGAGELDLALAEELEHLGPFGAGNPRPSLLVPAVRIEDVRAMGEEGRHARFAIRGGSGRASAVAFRTSPGSLRAAAEAPHEVAVRLERNEWNGAVEARLVLSAMRRADAAATCELLDEREPFWTALARALEDPVATAAPGSREVLDARRRGFAALTADLLSAGDRVLVLCADAARRREGVARAATGEIAVGSWDLLEARPELSAEFEHVVALDPPPLPEGRELLAALHGRGFAHLAWSRPDVEFALAACAAQLELRPALAELYRGLREGRGKDPDSLTALLRGGGRHPRGALECARLLRVLRELSLVELDPAAPSCRALDAPRTELERSATYRSSAARLAAARAWLGGLLGEPAGGRAGVRAA